MSLFIYEGINKLYSLRKNKYYRWSIIALTVFIGAISLHSIVSINFHHPEHEITAQVLQVLDGLPDGSKIYLNEVSMLSYSQTTNLNAGHITEEMIPEISDGYVFIIDTGINTVYPNILEDLADKNPTIMLETEHLLLFRVE